MKYELFHVEVSKPEEEVRVPLKDISVGLDGTGKCWRIYRFHHMETRKSYIGQATNLTERWRSHCSSPPRKAKEDIEKFKIKYRGGLKAQCIFEVIGWAKSQEEADEFESFFIKVYRSSGNTGYNDLVGRGSKGGKRALSMIHWVKKQKKSKSH